MADVFWIADPASASGRDDCRLLVGVETSETLYLLMEGPSPRPRAEDVEPRGVLHLRVSGPDGELVFMQGGSSSSDRDRTMIVAWYRPPPEPLDALALALELDGTVVMRVTAVRQ